MVMATERQVPMAVNKLLTGVLLVLAAGAGAAAQEAGQAPGSSPSSSTAGSSPSSSNPSGSSSSTSSGSSSSNSHRGAHHVRVPDEDAPAQAPELAQAEAAIEKKNYVAAEGLLQKLVQRDGSSYVAWFDLGFVENAMGNVDGSIAAYRKSVAAKPDVFESNLNLGLQLAQTGQPDGEQYLLAATQLKPTSHVAEGHARAWISLAH